MSLAQSNPIFLTSHLRGSPAIVRQRNGTPYANFAHQVPSHSHPEPARTLEDQLSLLNINLPDSSQQSNVNAASSHSHPTASGSGWIRRCGHGSKHGLDPFQFSLWNSQTRSYRNPSLAEFQSIANTFNAKSIRFDEPYILVVTNNPPQPVPLTIASCPALFISEATANSGWKPHARHGTQPYANPRIPDPVDINLRATKPWAFPSRADFELIATELGKFVKFIRLTFDFPFLHVLISDDGTRYQPRTLPGRIAGYSATYENFGNTSQTSALAARSRDLTPTKSVAGDFTNYILERQYLCPGIRVQGKQSTSSCGVKIFNGEEERITVSNHAFLANDDLQVFHPSISETNREVIGTIKERYAAQDWALAVPSFHEFRNSENFEAEAPTKLLKSSEVVNGSWFECDGATTGLVYLLANVIDFFSPPRPQGYPAIAYQKFEINFGFVALGAIGTEPLAAGICGAPIVGCDDDNKGGVAGFFQLEDGGALAFSPVLDKLIDDGWQILA